MSTPTPLAEATSGGQWTLRPPDGVGWESAATAFTADGWVRISREYMHRIATPQAHAAASCALQSHASQVVGVCIGNWLDDLSPTGFGPVWEPERHSIWLRYEMGSAREVAVSGPQRIHDGDVEDLWLTIHGYLAELVGLAIRLTAVPCRTAWGNVAASCAGQFRRHAESVAGHDRAKVFALAERFFDAPGWPYRRLVVLEEYPSGRVGYRRGVCCLIHSGSAGHHCAGCCLHTDHERAHRWQEG